MPLILCIETATTVCSVALTKDGITLKIKETHINNSHAEVVTVFIDELIKEFGFAYGDLDAVAVSKGPGSYTGLRIGVSTAKGLCYALDIPLIGLSTLKTLAACMVSRYNEQDDHPVLFCPMIDARRMEVYSALFDKNLQEVRETKAEIIENNSFSDLLKSNRLLFFGDGAAKCKEFIHHPNAVFYENIFPSARNMVSLAHRAFNSGRFENVAYFEPYYLKDFIPGIPNVKGLK
jgi:tRNA threonylcarbamoyladenosine biosynthesis protein TsaB